MFDPIYLDRFCHRHIYDRAYERSDRMRADIAGFGFSGYVHLTTLAANMKNKNRRKTLATLSVAIEEGLELTAGCGNPLSTFTGRKHRV